MEKRYYWLKLKEDFFSDDPILILLGMQNGRDYVLLYLRLLCMAVGTDGALRYSAELPYNDQMLAAVTATNVDIVRGGMAAFRQLGLAELLPDGTIFFPQLADITGSETDAAQRMRNMRQRKHDEESCLPLQQKSDDVTTLHESYDDVTPLLQECHKNVTTEKREERIDISSSSSTARVRARGESEKEVENEENEEKSGELYEEYHRLAGRLLLSDEQWEKLSDELTADELIHYIDVLDECIKGGHRPKGSYDFIMRMVRADRKC